MFAIVYKEIIILEAFAKHYRKTLLKIWFQGNLKGT